MANSRQVNWRVLKSLKDTSIIKDFNWCNFLLVELCMRIREYKARDDDESTRNVGGCILFLELFYLDRVHHGGQPTIKRSRSQRRMIGWTNEIIRERTRKEMKEAKSFGFGKIAEDPLYRIIEAERQELLIKEERKEETKDGEDSANEDKQLNRFGELIDEVINASNAVQIANKNLFAKIKKIQKEFPSQTVSICDYLKIKAPSVVEEEEEDEEETSILFNTVDLMADVWMKAKQTFLREYKINVDVNKENEEVISKEKELHDVAKESRGKVQEDEVEKFRHSICYRILKIW